MITEIDCPVLTAEQVLKASGHLTRFSDLMVRDSITNESFRVDHLLEGELNKKKPNKTLTRYLNNELVKFQLK